MEDSMELGIKLVIYNDGYHTNIVKEITGFNNAREAAHYRDNSEYAALPSELQLDYNNYLDGRSTSSDDMRDLNTDDGKTLEKPRQVIQYHKGFHFDYITFILALVVVLVATFLLFPWLVSFFLLILEIIS